MLTTAVGSRDGMVPYLSYLIDLVSCQCKTILIPKSYILLLFESTWPGYRK